MKTTRIKKLVTAFLCLLTYASAQAQFTGSAEQYPTNDYSTVPITFSLSAVATQVGTDAGTLAAALDTWMAGNSDTNLLFLVDPADGTTLVDGYSTNAKGGFWMSSEGANTGYGADATWYEDISWDEGSDLFAFNAGQMPDTLVAGMSCSAKFALVYNEKRADFTITLNIVAKPVYEIPEPATLVEKDLNVTGEATVNMEQFPRGGYDSDVVDIVLDDLAAKLGLDNNAVFGDELAQLLYATEYNNGDVEEGGGMKKESLSNRFTAGAPGFWFRAVQNEEGIETGECSSTDWGASDAFFMEAFRFDTATNTLTCNVGQYPGSLKGGEKLFTNVYIVYGDKVYRIRYNLDIKEKEQGSGLAGYNLVGSDEVIAEQEPTDDYSPVAIHPDMDAIAEALGCEVSAIGMYALDDKDNFAGSTANNGGFWFDGAGTVTSWGATAAFFIEPPTANDFSTLNVGQYPNVLNVGDEVSANLYFINGENYFNYHVTLKIVEPTYIPTEFESVATRTFSVQTLLTTDYTCSETWNIPNEVVMELIDTSAPELYGLAIDSVAAQTGEIYSKKYSCTPYPGFWLNSDGRVSVWGDSDALVGICYGSDGTFTFYQYPNRNSVGDAFKTQLFLVNTETNKMITFNITLNFVESLVQKEEVGSENLVIPVSTDEKDIILNGKTAADALGVTVADLLDRNNYYLRAMTSSGVYGEGQNAEMGLSFDLDGGYNAYGNMYFTLAGGEGDNIVLTMCSNDPVDSDYSVDGQFCFEVGDKQYVYYVKFVSEAIYEGINEMTTQSGNNGLIYDLTGRTVVKPMRGIYIQNGKKFVVK